MDFGGLGNMMSAVPGGYQQGMQANNQIDQQQLALVDQRAKQAGAAAYFRALQGMLGPQSGQGPQPPMPGQPSMSSSAMPGPQIAGPQGPSRPDSEGVYPQNATMLQTPGGGAYPPMQSSPAGMPQQPQGAAAPSPPGGQPPGGQQQISWQGIIQALKAQNPGASDLELAHAVDHFMPMMTMQNKLEWQQMRNDLMWEMTKMRTDTQARGQDVRATTMDNRTQQQREVEEGRSDRFGVAEDRRERSLSQRDQQFQQREQRLQDALQLRGDTTWARLDQQKQALEERVRSGDKIQAVREWRATLDAQHKMAMERIQATSVNNAMKPAERTKLLTDQNAWYRGEIEKMRNLSTQRGNLSDQGEPTGQTVTDLPAGKAPPAAPAAPAAGATAQALPPAAMQALKERQVTTFGNGQKWTLRNGQPEQVQ